MMSLYQDRCQNAQIIQIELQNVVRIPNLIFSKKRGTLEYRLWSNCSIGLYVPACYLFLTVNTTIYFYKSWQGNIHISETFLCALKMTPVFWSLTKLLLHEMHLQDLSSLYKQCTSRPPDLYCHVSRPLAAQKTCNSDF